MIAIIGDSAIHTSMHKLHFSSTDGKNDVNVLIYHSQKFPIVNGNPLIKPENIELLSGDCFISSLNIGTLGNSIQAKINLKLANDDDDENLWYSPPMNLVYEKTGDIFEIKLKYVDSESDFFIEWEGPLKEINNQ